MSQNGEGDEAQSKNRPEVLERDLGVEGVAGGAQGAETSVAGAEGLGAPVADTPSAAGAGVEPATGAGDAKEGVTPAPLGVARFVETYDTSGLPEELLSVAPLWETRGVPSPVGSGDREMSLSRLYPDGRKFMLSEWVAVLNAEGRVIHIKEALRWRLSMVVEASAIAGLEAAIAETFMQLPETDENSRVRDGTQWTWTAYLSDGRVHRVQRRAVAPPEVTAISHAIARGMVQGAVSMPRAP